MVLKTPFCPWPIWEPPFRSKLSGQTVGCLHCVAGLSCSAVALISYTDLAFHFDLVCIISSQLRAPVFILTHLLFLATLELLGGRWLSFFICLLDDPGVWGCKRGSPNTLLPESTQIPLFWRIWRHTCGAAVHPPHTHVPPHPSLQLQEGPDYLLLSVKISRSAHHRTQPCGGNWFTIIWPQEWRGQHCTLQVKSRTIEAPEALLVFLLETGKEQRLLTHQSGESSLFLVVVPKSFCSYVWGSSLSMVDSCGWLGPDGNDNDLETQESRDPIRSHFDLRMSSLTFLKEINRKTKPKSSSDNNNNTENLQKPCSVQLQSHSC